MADIQDILPLKTGGIVSLTGAGGKTSVMFHLAAGLSDAGKKVLTTTTTKIYPPLPLQSETIILSNSTDELLEKASVIIRNKNHITAASALIRKENKLKGFSTEMIHQIQQSNFFDWILIEADGAAQRLLKAPAEHEPVIPVNTDIWIGVAGLDVIDKPLVESIVFRPELVSQITGLPIGKPIGESHLATLALHPLGFLKNVPTKAIRCFFLNKADNKKAMDSGRKIVNQIKDMESGQLNAVVIGEAQNKLIVHDWFFFKAFPKDQPPLPKAHTG